MKSLPHLDYSFLKIAQGEPKEEMVGGFKTPEEDAKEEMARWRKEPMGKKPVGKYGNLANFLKERSGVSIDDASLDKKLRTFFEDMITEILKNPASFDRTKNINFSELFNYLEETDKQIEQNAQ